MNQKGKACHTHDRLGKSVLMDKSKLSSSIAEVKSGVKSPEEQQSLWDVIFSNLYKLRMKG